MTGGISLLSDFLPPREVPQSSHGRFSPEEERPYVQVQARVPVQAPIPRLAKALWDNEDDNATRDLHPLPSLQTTVSSSREESQDLRPPAPGPMREALHAQSFPTDERVMNDETYANARLAYLPETLSEQLKPDLEQQRQVSAKPSPRPVSPMRESDTEEPPTDESVVVNATPIEQEVSLASEHPNEGSENEDRDIQEPVDELPARTPPLPPASVAEVAVERSPSPTPSEPPRSSLSSPQRGPLNPPESLSVSSASPPCQVQEPILVAASQSPLHAAPAEEPLHSLPTPSPIESIAPSQAQQEEFVVTQPAAPTPPHPAMENEADEQSKDSMHQTLDIDTSDLKPMSLSESVPDIIPPEVLNVVSPDATYFEPEMQAKPELKLEQESNVVQPTAVSSHSPTPPPMIKAEAHPDIDALISMSFPPPSDRRSAEVLESNDGVETPCVMDMDVDEELLSLLEGPPRRSQPATVGTRIPAVTVEGPEQGLRVPVAAVDEQRDRESMPPSASRTKKGEKGDKYKDKSVTPAASSKKKKHEAVSKAPAKPKQQQKSRAKSTAKPKGKASSSDVPRDASKSTIPPKVTVNAARSRSTSVMPVVDVKEETAPEAEVDASDKEDDKLYCVCKTQYDEDRMMIACDRCDEWYHTQCVNVSDVEIDLVDQFMCPPCVKRNPELRTTWKRRCQFGLKHENPSSPSACHKPCRGAFSKYCSDECGIKSMQQRISEWEISGGKREVLWEVVKNAEKREGIVVRADFVKPLTLVTNGSRPEERRASRPDAAGKRRVEWEIGRLNVQLEEVVTEREMVKREMDTVLWREKVVDLAAERAEYVDQCGWDQRLCFGEEEWVDFGAEVLESYEEKGERTDEAMQVDGSSAHCEWWCTGKKKCERHAGWQKLRTAEVSFDKEMTEGILLKLTTREREIRKRIEDILYPQTSQTVQSPRLNGRSS